MYLRNGKIEVFEPTLREIEELTHIFDNIKWLGYYYGDAGHKNFREPKTSRIKCIFLPKAQGGKAWYNKLLILPYLPGLIFVIISHTLKSKYIHTRGPSIPALISILVSVFLPSKRMWHKYAGNWREVSPPLSYMIQRALLKRRKQFVAVNGKEVSDSPSIHQFENPCFTEYELELAKQVADSKSFKAPYEILFVGRIEKEKGALTAVRAFAQLKDDFHLRMVGDGKDYSEVLDFITKNNLSVELFGAVSREELNRLYSRAHFLLLPTAASEGFPKVLAEAAGFGCIPVVTAISSIPDYIVNMKNGLILDNNEIDSILKVFNNLPDVETLEKLKIGAIEMASMYTYERYVGRIMNEYLGS